MNPLSLYVHVPFCIRKCGYCDFLSVPPLSSNDISDYVDGLLAELRLRRLLLGPRPLDTIFFGGGSPSMLEAAQIKDILETASDLFGVSEDAEITVEANPTRENPGEWLSAIRQAGVNRISIGAQSFQPRILEVLDRRQSPEDVSAFYSQARSAAFDNIGLDLILGAPGCSIDDFDEDVYQALALDPEHISIYCLEIHDDTPLGRKISEGEISPPDESAQIDMYNAARHRLKSAGYLRYEISNFSKPEFESRHNIAYWKSLDYLGVGPGAAAHFDGARSANRSGDDWSAAILSGALPTAWSERLSSPRRIRELAVMRLRLRDGFDIREFEGEFSRKLVDALRADCDGLAPRLEQPAPGVYRLPDSELYFSNDLFSELIY